MCKRNCAVVKCVTGNTWAFAMVKFFVKYDMSSTREPMYLAIAYPILCDNYNPKLHINRMTPCNREQTVVFNVSTISTVCTFLSLPKKTKRTQMCVSFQIRKNVTET